MLCDVCRLVDGNRYTRPQPCFYCSKCNAWICVRCSRSWFRRSLAALLRRWKRAEWTALPVLLMLLALASPDRVHAQSSCGAGLQNIPTMTVSDNLNKRYEGACWNPTTHVITFPLSVIGGGNLSGTLTAGRIPVASGANTLINGSLVDDHFGNLSDALGNGLTVASSFGIIFGVTPTGSSLTVGGLGILLSNNLGSTLSLLPSPCTAFPSTNQCFAVLPSGGTSVAFAFAPSIGAGNKNGGAIWYDETGATGLTVEAPDSLTSNRNISWPDASGTVALTANNLGAFAATTSAQLAGVISDETGTGVLVFSTSPTFTTQILLPDGASAAPGWAFSSATGTGAYRVAGNGNMRFTRNGADIQEIAAAGINLNTGLVLDFAGSGGFGTLDTGLSRSGVNTLALGTGAAGNAGGTLALATLNASANIQGATYTTATNCANGSAPATCGSAASGAVAVPTGTNPTLTINTTAVGANSRIFVQDDESLTIAATTCNTTLSTLVQPVVTARTAGTSFTIQIGAVITTNPACVSYHIID